MEIIKSTTKFKFTDKDIEILKEAATMLVGIRDELDDNTISGYDEADLDLAVDVISEIVGDIDSFNEVGVV